MRKEARWSYRRGPELLGLRCLLCSLPGSSLFDPLVDQSCIIKLFSLFSIRILISAKQHLLYRRRRSEATHFTRFTNFVLPSMSMLLQQTRNLPKKSSELYLTRSRKHLVDCSLVRNTTVTCTWASGCNENHSM